MLHQLREGLVPVSDALYVNQGARPWLPANSDTTEVVVLHRYSIPLVGIIEQHGVRFVYWCVAGHAAPENAWAYAAISPDAEEALRGALDGPSFNALLQQTVHGRACTFAVAVDDRIIESVTLSPAASFDDVHERGMEQLAEKLRETMREYMQLQESFPALHSAASFSLVPTPQVSRRNRAM